MELVHPDALLGEEFGKFGEIDSAYLAGKGAVEAARNSRRNHMRGTGEEYDTARIIGDFGLILKTSAAPRDRVDGGERALRRVQESAVIGAGFSGGPVNVRLATSPATSFRRCGCCFSNGGDVEATAGAIRDYKMQSFIDPELALCALAITRKAEVVNRDR